MHDLDRKEKEDLEALERKLKEEKDKIFSEASAKHEAEARARTDLSEEQIQQVRLCNVYFDRCIVCLSVVCFAFVFCPAF